MSPYLTYPAVLSGDEWCVVTASDEFLSKSVPDKIIVAERFYEKNIQGLADELFYDNDELKSWFIKSAQMTIQEAPIKDYKDITFPQAYKYRDFHDWPKFKIWKAFFNSATFIASLVSTLLLMAVIIIIFSIVKWVSGGFRLTGGLK